MRESVSLRHHLGRRHVTAVQRQLRDPLRCRGDPAQRPKGQPDQKHPGQGNQDQACSGDGELDAGEADQGRIDARCGQARDVHVTVGRSRRESAVALGVDPHGMRATVHRQARQSPERRRADLGDLPRVGADIRQQGAPALLGDQGAGPLTTERAYRVRFIAGAATGMRRRPIRSAASEAQGAGRSIASRNSACRTIR